MEKEKQIAVIKFLKTEGYQKNIKRYNESYEQDKKYFEAKYEWGEGYQAQEPTKSEIDMFIDKLNFFKEKLEDIDGDSDGAEILMNLLYGNIEGIKSHLYNTTTNGMGMSKDTPIFTEDDLRKYIMLHKKDFHILIVTLMNPTKEFDSTEEKYKIYESPEDFEV